MALADITSKIIQDAEHEAARIITGAQNEAHRIAVNADKTRSDAVAHIESQGVKKTEEIKKKVDNLADHHRKAMTLQSKREVIDDVFNEAIALIASADVTKKEAYFITMLKSIDANTGTIHPVKADEGIVQKAVQKSGKNFQIWNQWLCLHFRGIRNGFSY